LGGREDVRHVVVVAVDVDQEDMALVLACLLHELAGHAQARVMGSGRVEIQPVAVGDALDLGG
jgi:hypothetical protein